MYIQAIIEIKIDKTSVRKVHFKICDLFQKKLWEIKILIMTIISATHGQLKNTSEIY